MMGGGVKVQEVGLTTITYYITFCACHNRSSVYISVHIALNIYNNEN